MLELPFTDLIGSKLRPILALNSVDLGEDIIVAKVTSKPGKFRLAITQKDLTFGRLKKEPSYIDCSSIFTVEKRLIVKTVARLDHQALLRVKEELRTIFNI